jgi:exodeoxyribonuclease VII small subunit
MAKAELSYEEAREQLGEIVRKLEAGSVPLSESMALWERGEQLATICQKWLDGARAKIDAARAEASARPEAAGRAEASGDQD